MIEASIEAAIIAALQTALPAAHIDGFWQPADAGTAKLAQGSMIFVVCKPKGNEQETVPVYSTQCEIVASVLLADDPTGATILAWGDAISSLPDGWNGRPGTPERAALVSALTGTGYSVTGLVDNAGDCGIDFGMSAWFVSKTIMIHFVAS